MRASSKTATICKEGGENDDGLGELQMEDPIDGGPVISIICAVPLLQRLLLLLLVNYAPTSVTIRRTIQAFLAYALCHCRQSKRPSLGGVWPSPDGARKRPETHASSAVAEFRVALRRALWLLFELARVDWACVEVAEPGCPLQAQLPLHCPRSCSRVDGRTNKPRQAKESPEMPSRS